VRTTEVPATAAACHESHPHSIVGLALRTLAGTAGFGHRYVSMTGRLSSQNILPMMWRILQDMAHIRHRVSAPLLTHRCSALQFKTDMCCSLSFRSQEPRCEPSQKVLQVYYHDAGLRLCRLAEDKVLHWPRVVRFLRLEPRALAFCRSPISTICTRSLHYLAQALSGEDDYGPRLANMPLMAYYPV
jgi:hypothetical protein